MSFVIIAPADYQLWKLHHNPPALLWWFLDKLKSAGIMAELLILSRVGTKGIASFPAFPVIADNRPNSPAFPGIKIRLPCRHADNTLRDHCSGRLSALKVASYSPALSIVETKKMMPAFALASFFLIHQDHRIRNYSVTFFADKFVISTNTSLFAPCKFFTSESEPSA